MVTLDIITVRSAGRATKRSVPPEFSGRCRCVSLSFSILRHVVIDFVGPGADTAFDTLQILETLLLQKLQRFQRADAALAMDVILPVRVQLGESLRQCAEGKQRHAVDVRDLVFE